MNESLNQTIACFAPKNRTYCGSKSLANRVGMACSIHLAGYDSFMEYLCMEVGLEIDDRLLFCLTQEEMERKVRLKLSRMAAYKAKRKQDMFCKIKEYFSMLSNDQALDQAYAPGSAMDDHNDPITERNETAVDFGGTTVTQQVNSIVRCKRCGGVGHKTANSKMCRFHRSRMQNGSVARIVNSSSKKDIPDQVPRKKRDGQHDLGMAGKTDDSPVTTGRTNNATLPQVRTPLNTEWMERIQVTTQTHAMSREIHGEYSSSGTDNHHTPPSQNNNASKSIQSELPNTLGDVADQLSIVDTIWCPTDTEEENQVLTEMFDDLLEVS